MFDDPSNFSMGNHDEIKMNLDQQTTQLRKNAYDVAGVACEAFKGLPLGNYGSMLENVSPNNWPSQLRKKGRAPND
jgi:hypothetical protein